MKNCSAFVSVLTAILGFSKLSECEYMFESSSPTISGCEGGTADFDWTYTPSTPVPASITWTKRNPDGTLLATLATFSLNTFTVDAAYTGRVTRVGNGQIKLSGIVANDEGQYQINVVDGTNSKTSISSKAFTFYAPPAGTLSLTSSGSVTIVVGDLTSKGTPQVSVQCQDQKGNMVVDKVPPYNETLPSPVANGMYTCRVTGGSLDCLDPDDRLRKEFFLYIDGSCTAPDLAVILSVAVVALLIILVVIAVFVVSMKTKLLEKFNNKKCQIIFIVIGALVVVAGLACSVAVLVLCQNIITFMIKVTVAMSIICLLVGFIFFVVAIIRFSKKKNQRGSSLGTN